MRSARFGFKEVDEKPIRTYRCAICGFLIRARYQPLPWKGPVHECRYIEVEPMTEARGSRWTPTSDQPSKV